MATLTSLGEEQEGRTPERSGDWTVLAYFAGDNNLAEEMVWSLQEMQKARSLPGFTRIKNLRAYYDPAGSSPRIFPRRTKPHGHSSLGGSAAPPLLDFEDAIVPIEAAAALESNVSYVYSRLSQFIDSELRKLYEAGSGPDHTMIILSGHGSGAVGDFLQNSTPAGSLSIPELGLLLKVALELYTDYKPDRANGSAPKIKILGMESCAMSTLEVCYQVRESVEVMVATESLVQDLGWPYLEMLRPFTTTATTSADYVKDIAKQMARAYSHFYTDYDIAGVSSDIAAIDVGHLKDSVLADLIRILVHGAKEELNKDHGAGPYLFRDAVIVARARAQSYKVDEYVDLWDFCDQLRQALGADHDLSSICSKIKRELDRLVLLSCYQGPDYQHSHGLSIYFPTARASYAQEYENLEFPKVTRWHEFLMAFLDTSRRERRAPRKDMKDEKLRYYDWDFIPQRDKNDHECVEIGDFKGRRRSDARGGPKGESRGGPKGESRLAQEVLSYTKNSPPGWFRDRCESDPSTTIKNERHETMRSYGESRKPTE